MSFVLLVIGGVLVGGALSLWRQPVPKVAPVAVGLVGVLATVAGALRL